MAERKRARLDQAREPELAEEHDEDFVDGEDGQDSEDDRFAPSQLLSV